MFSNPIGKQTKTLKIILYIISYHLTEVIAYLLWLFLLKNQRVYSYTNDSLPKMTDL